jgi:hypothetical protein
MLAGMGAYMAAIMSLKWRRGLASPRLENRRIICALLLSIGAYLFILMSGIFLRDAWILGIVSGPVHWVQGSLGFITWLFTVLDISCVVFPLLFLPAFPFFPFFYYIIQ